MKPILSNQLLIRGTFRYLTVAVFGDSPKFHSSRGSVRDGNKSEKKTSDGSNTDDDDFYDDWAYVKVGFTSFAKFRKSLFCSGEYFER